MELVANIWPVFDAQSGVIQRFAARAYALDGDDAVISQTLRGLAPGDYLMARQFPIPENIRLVTPHGTLNGAIQLPYWGERQSEILEDAFRVLEEDRPATVGMWFDGPHKGGLVSADLTFPPDPYIITTFLEEDAGGHLRVIHAR